MQFSLGGLCLDWDGDLDGIGGLVGVGHGDGGLLVARGGEVSISEGEGGSFGQLVGVLDVGLRIRGFAHGDFSRFRHGNRIVQLSLSLSRRFFCRLVVAADRDEVGGGGVGGGEVAGVVKRAWLGGGCPYRIDPLVGAGPLVARRDSDPVGDGYVGAGRDDDLGDESATLGSLQGGGYTRADEPEEAVGRLFSLRGGGGGGVRDGRWLDRRGISGNRSHCSTEREVGVRGGRGFAEVDGPLHGAGVEIAHGVAAVDTPAGQEAFAAPLSRGVLGPGGGISKANGNWAGIFRHRGALRGGSHDGLVRQVDLLRDRHATADEGNGKASCDRCGLSAAQFVFEVHG